MADENPPAPATDAPPTPDQDGMTTDAGRRALQAERARVATLEKKLSDLEAAGKSDTDRVNERIATLERETNEARTEALRMRIAAKHKISDEDAELFLTGSDEATLTKQAKRLAEQVAERTKTERKRSGVVDGEGKTNTNPAGDSEIRDFARQLFAGADS